MVRPQTISKPHTLRYSQHTQAIGHKEQKDFFFQLKKQEFATLFWVVATIWCVFSGRKNEELKIRGTINTNFPNVVLGNLSFLPTSSRPENSLQ